MQQTSGGGICVLLLFCCLCLLFLSCFVLVRCYLCLDSLQFGNRLASGRYIRPVVINGMSFVRSVKCI